MATITGDNSGTTLTGTSSPDLIYAYDGNDTVLGGDGGDYINGGRGNDNLYGELGDDIFEIGGSGSDMGLNPAGGTNSGWDNFFGGEGYDTIRILPTAGYEWTAIMINSLSGIEALDNTSGGPGYVLFQGTVDFSSVVSMTNINHIQGTAGNETFIGGSLAETVFGVSGNDTLYGKGGNDVLSGDDGNDKLYGGLGDDDLYGGAGADQFWFAVGEGTDFINDYVDGTDKIGVGATVSGLNVYNYSGSALLEFTAAGATSTYALLIGVAPTAIDGSDFLWA
ncbi:calcium-binding protein [Rhizobium leguminosarum]|uniref:calcium-binding protein n=1 Tax=Rhizobium leguminosarum TaxID=384 RepID=UPI003F9C28C3